MKSLTSLLHRALLGIIVLAAPVAALAKPAAGQGIGLPRDISTNGELIDSGLHFGNVAVALLFIMVVVWLAIAFFVHNEKHKAKYDHGNSKRAALLVAGFTVVIFLVVDGHHYYASVVELDETFWNFNKVDNADALRVEVNGRQWAWQFRYAGPDGKFATADDITTLNDLRVPVDKPVVIQLRSVDVIHSLYIPNVRVKLDAVPGTTNRLWFQVDKDKLAEAGSNEFDIACAQHCGTWHYKMHGIMTVYSNYADFKAWMDEAAVNAALDHPEPPTKEEVEKGAALPVKYGPDWGWTWEQKS